MGRLNRSRQMGQRSSSSDSVLAIVSMSGNKSRERSRRCYCIWNKLNVVRFYHIQNQLCLVNCPCLLIAMVAWCRITFS